MDRTNIIFGNKMSSKTIVNKTIANNIEKLEENKLDFVGKTLETKTIHSKTDQEEDIVTIDVFSYDRVGRLLDQYQCIGDGSLTSCSGVSNFQNNITLTSPLDLTENETQIIAKQSITLAVGFEAAPSANQSVVFTIDADAPAAAQLIVSNSYDELGQLKSKKVGNSHTPDKTNKNNFSSE